MIMVLKEVSFVVAAPKLTQGEHKFLSTCYVLVKASLLLCVKNKNKITHLSVHPLTAAVEVYGIQEACPFL